MRKLILVLLLVINAVLGIVLWFQADKELPLLLSTFFADATLGLAAGLGARIVFRNWNRIAQYLVVILSVVIGMILLGNLTDAVLGIGPLALQREASNQIRQLSFDSTLPSQLRSLDIDLRTFIDFSKMEASDVAHIAGSLLLAVMSLQAWRSTRQVIEVEPLGHSQIEVEPRNSGVSLAPGGSNGSHAHQPVSWFRSPGGGATPTPRIRSKNRIRSAARNDAKSARRSRSRRRRPQIQLAVVEEHRCPYCLDPVVRNDPRGVKECDVCHSLHHADCWAITGFCQVPHLNS